MEMVVIEVGVHRPLAVSQGVDKFWVQRSS